MASVICIYLLLHIVDSVITENISINIFAISNLMNGSGDGIAMYGAEWIAAQEINNNTDLLPNVEFSLHRFDSENNPQRALIHAIAITEFESANVYNFPIILGCPWSSLSESAATVLNAYNMGLISSSATSVSLSNTKKYPYFYRTIPSDSLQAQGLILLCNEFGWTTIGVVYVNDAYGLNLALGIQNLGTLHNIDVTSIAISYEYDETYNHAAKQIKDLQIYIVILILHSTNNLFKEFAIENILKYPWFYLGTDAWFDQSVIKSWNVTDETRGLIGTVPFTPHSDMNVDGFNEKIRGLVNISIHKWKHILSLWTYYYDNGHQKDLFIPFNRAVKTNFMLYGYDAMFTIALVLQKLIDLKYNFIELYNNNTYKLIKLLNDIIINDIDFNGATGHVTFDKNGDRIDGLYAFANILQDGTINNFGYFYEDMNGDIIINDIDFNGATGHVTFDKNGDRIDGLYAFANILQDGKIKLLNDIIINDIDFNGATGHVTFDKNGDRIDGLYAFANILQDGTINNFGYFYEDMNGEIISNINKDKIVFPYYFTENGL
eukprot:435790_1